jgi:hypothetical protein
VHGLRVADELIARHCAHHPASFHQVVILRARERRLLAGRNDFCANAECEGVRRPDRVGVEAGARADVAGARAAVAEVHGRAVVRMTDDGEERAAHGPSAVLQLDDLADDLSVLATFECGRAFRAQLRGRHRTDQDCVIPGQPRDRLRQFLKPAVVGEPAVED